MKTLQFLLKDIAVITDQHAHIQIDNITNDSRQVSKNTLFIAYKGDASDGRKYISQAIDKGAVAICYEPSDDFVLPEIKIPAFAIKNLKIMQSTIAARFYEFPSRKIPVIGVTGTNGKTSITHFIAQMFTLLDKGGRERSEWGDFSSCGIIGTIGYGFPNHLTKTSNTTPDAIQLQKIFAEFIDQGAQAVAIEVSSHALDQQRVRDVRFHTAVFTNLTQDHLDYHQTMEKYRDAKELLFQQPDLKNAVINIDDEAGIYFANKYGRQNLTTMQMEVRATATAQHKQTVPINIVTYSLHNKSADIYVDSCIPTPHGFELTIHSPWGNGDCHLPLIGEFNVYNALAAIAALEMILPTPQFQAILEHLSHLKTVPGRMELFQSKNSPSIIVDYAHTPDALEKALQSVRKHCQGKLICVFGCGGNRDKTKRPLMGAIAEKCADNIIITNDNPRNEDPTIIAEEIVRGMMRSGIGDWGSVIIELDRTKAIETAIQSATQNDWILIAGKGHETEQIIGEKSVHHSDVECVLEQLNNAL